MILDGYGLSDKTEGNAVKQAKTPVMDKLIAKYPFVQGEASGMAVGLPDGQMGNSEVGHTNMGAGRIVYQMLVKISKSIQDGDFFENKALVAAMENCKKNDSALHLMGLLSPGGVHSHMEHLYGLLEMAKKNGLEKVYVHAYLDGRDVPPSSAAEYMEELVAKIKEIGVGSVATISGRFYAMDRDNAWDREEKAYSALVYGEGVQADDPVQAIKDSYANDVTDEFPDGGIPTKEVVYKIFEPLNDGTVSKAITAQYLAGMLAGELAPVSDGTVNRDEVKYIVENDDKLKYLVEAIKHVTE